MQKTRRFVIEPSVDASWWMVTEDRGEVSAILHDGSAQSCIDWCVDQGAVRLGPRVYVTED